MTGKVLPTTAWRAEGRRPESDLIHAKSEHVSLDASLTTLGINGIAPPNQNNGPVININNSVSAGYVIDIAEPPRSNTNRATNS
jgi:hypothetical protein